MHIMEDNNKTPETGAVLVVDDQATQRTKFEMDATRPGHRVTSEASAADACSSMFFLHICHSATCMLSINRTSPRLAATSTTQESMLSFARAGSSSVVLRILK